MSEQNNEPKIYPGSLDRYRDLRKLREEIESVPDAGGRPGSRGENQQAYLLASIAEEFAGLAYILDGIRYAARKS